MATTVEVRIELGHRAKIRGVPTEDGRTHDWMVYVKGSEGIALGYFVEKVVFHLHETYMQPKRVVKQPPFRVEESGFAGFNMPIDVYFRNREEPKTVRFEYDLFLHLESMPPVNHTRLEKLTFTNPTEDFRKKLLEAGALLIRPPDRHSSKERSHGSPSLHSKKDRSKVKDHSKRHSEGTSHEERKKSASISSKKEGRIAAKDIKRHEDEFKHPKMPELVKAGKDGSHDSTHRERGRSEKKRSATDVAGSKKKKKKHSSSSPHPQGSRPKSLNLPSSTASSTKKEKVRKIKDKPDLMAGLFAPENSINMSHIKQSKEKMKTEPNSESKLKKEKRAMALTPTGTADSPRLDELNRGNSSKASPSGNLTLKIKKERLPPSSTDKDSKKDNQSMKRKEKKKAEKSDDSKTKHKKRIKENPDVVKVKHQKPSKPTSIIMSSSSGTDMEISSSSDSSPERPQKPSSKSSSLKESTSGKKLHKTTKTLKESVSSNDKVSKKSSGQVSSKSDKIKIEKSHIRSESPNISRSKEKTKSSESPRSQTLGKLTKKVDKKELKPIESREKDTSSQIPRKSKKEKRSSREKDGKVHKDSKRAKISVPEAKATPERPSANMDSTMPPVTKPQKPSKSPSQHVKERHIHKRTADKKSSKNSDSMITKPRPTIKNDVKSEKLKTKKEPSFTDSDSSDDGDLPSDIFATKIPPRHSPIDGKTSHPQSSRSNLPSSSSSSSSSSAASSASENVSSHNSSSSSADSSDEEELQEIHKKATLTGPALSPIDSEYNSHQNAKTYSGESSSPGQDNISHPSQTESVAEDTIPDEPAGHESPAHNMDVRNHDLYTTSDEEEELESLPLEKPFQDHSDAAFEDEPQSEEPPNIIIETGEAGTYPHMTQEMYSDLQDLHRRLSYVTDVERLSKIANIVHRSQKLLHNDDYLDFDLCALDERTIRKIKKELKAA